MNSAVRFFAGMVLSLGMTLPAAAEQPGSRITVAGRQVEPGVYAIAVESRLEVPGEYDGLLLWAEPSHTLLLVQANGDGRTPALESGERPLVAVSGRLAETAPSVRVRYEAGGDTRLVVQLARGSGRVTIADGRLNLAAFELTTTFEEPIADPLRIRIHHCVTCDPCGTMCVDCIGPRFTANCVECSIECGW